jgi:HEAT repeat protein
MTETVGTGFGHCGRRIGFDQKTRFARRPLAHPAALADDRAMRGKVPIAAAVLAGGGIIGGNIIGCVGRGPASRGLDDPLANNRIVAIKSASDAKDRGHVPRLVELTADEDPAVRLAANEALRRLTGVNLHTHALDATAAEHAWRDALGLPTTMAATAPTP